MGRADTRDPMENLKLLTLLKQMGVSFHVPVPNCAGCSIHLATPQQLLEFIKDQTALYAVHHGVTKAQYMAWMNDDCSVRCSAKTNSGTQCKHIITGGYKVTAKKWVQMQNEFCAIHGHQSSNTP